MDGQKKVDSARAPYCQGWRVSSQPLSPGVACAVASFSDEPMTGWMAAAVVTLWYGCASPYTPCYYRRAANVWLSSGMGAASPDRQNLMVCLRSMPNVFTGSCARMRCCLSENLLYRHRNGHIQAEWRKESNQRWCSDGFEFRCDNGKTASHVRAGLLWPWGTALGSHCGRLPAIETVQDVMPGSGGTPLRQRSFRRLQLEWLTDNGSCYRANETRQFADVRAWTEEHGGAGVRRVNNA